MEYIELEVYSQSINRGVIRMPSQNFPGLLLQGETLAALSRLARSIHEHAQTTTDTGLIETSQELSDTLQKLISHFEATLTRHNMPLPYSTIPYIADAT